MRPYNEAHHCQPNQLLESSNTLNNCGICMDLSYALRDALILFCKPIIQVHAILGKDVSESPQLLTQMWHLYVWVSFGYEIDESYFPNSPTIILVWEKM